MDPKPIGAHPSRGPDSEGTHIGIATIGSRARAQEGSNAFMGHRNAAENAEGARPLGNRYLEPDVDAKDDVPPPPYTRYEMGGNVEVDNPLHAPVEVENPFAVENDMDNPLDADNLPEEVNLYQINIINEIKIIDVYDVTYQFNIQEHPKNTFKIDFYHNYYADLNLKSAAVSLIEISDAFKQMWELYSPASPASAWNWDHANDAIRLSTRKRWSRALKANCILSDPFTRAEYDAGRGIISLPRLPRTAIG